MKISSSTLFMGAISLAAIGAIAIGASLLDSPEQARGRKLDERRLSDLRRITMDVERYRKAHEHLPERLEQLNVHLHTLKDPVTGQAYEYKTSDAGSYVLCANFDTIPGDDEQTPYNNYSECSVAWWKHDKGHYCYSIATKECR